MSHSMIVLSVIAVAMGAAMAAYAADDAAPRAVLNLPPSQENPRNSEGDFIQLRDGRILFVYTHFFGGAKDNSPSRLMSRESRDGGMTWSADDVLVLENEGRENTMSVSLLRLADGRIALFYLRKNSWTDDRPFVRFSSDEAKTWSKPVMIIPESEVGYYVMNNDRAVQLESGRLIAPVALHHDPGETKFTPYGRIMCYLSDDGGATWRRSRGVRDGVQENGERVMLQEPGVVALRDGRLMMFCRTNAGSQYISFSNDAGETWSRFEASNLISPRSPASIERLPTSGDLLAVWNDHRDIAAELRNKRTPLKVAVSADEGRTWSNVKTLVADRDGWYCYTAIEFVGTAVLLGHCAGNRTRNNGLAETQITRFGVDWLYR